MGDLTLSASACAWFLLGAFVLAGMAQTAWFAAPLSRRFSHPIDGGATLRGRASLRRAQDAARLHRDDSGGRASASPRSRRPIGDPAAGGTLAADRRGLRGPRRVRRLRLHGRRAAQLVREAAARHRARANARAIRRARRRSSLPIGSTPGVGMLLAVSAIVATPAMTWLLVLLVGPVDPLGLQRADVPPRPEGPSRLGAALRDMPDTADVAAPCSCRSTKRAATRVSSAARPRPVAACSELGVLSLAASSFPAAIDGSLRSRRDSRRGLERDRRGLARRSPHRLRHRPQLRGRRGLGGRVVRRPARLDCLVVTDADGLRDAILQCWRSRGSDRVRAYERARGHALGGLGIVIQQQIDIVDLRRAVHEGPSGEWRRRAASSTARARARIWSPAGSIRGE